MTRPISNATGEIAAPIELILILRDGWFRLRSAWKMLAIFYLANLGIGLLAALPFMTHMEQTLRGTAAEERVLTGFDYDWFSRMQDGKNPWVGSLELAQVGPAVFLRNYELLMQGTFLGLPPLLLGLAALYGLVQVFFAGGALSLLGRSAGPFRLSEFIRDCGCYFLRFLRILFIGLAVLLFSSMLIRPVLAWLRAFLNSRFSEPVQVLGGFGIYLFIGGLLAIWALLNDYSRIRLIQDGKNSALLSWLGAIYFACRRPRKILLLYLVFVAVGGALVFGYSAIDRSIAMNSAWRVIALFILQQVYLAVRIGMRLALLAGQTVLYQRYRFQNQPLFP